MHVLFEVKLGIVGGPQSWVCDIAPALKKRGIKVSVISIELTTPTTNHFLNRLHSEGITVHHIILEGTKLDKLRAIYAGFRSVGKCDIAHFNSDNFAGLIIPFAKIFHIPIRIIHSRTPKWGSGGQGWRDQLLYRLFQWRVTHDCTHGFGVTREALAGMFGARGCKRIPCTVVPSAIRSARFSDQIVLKGLVRLKARSNDLVMGFIGRFSPNKGLRLLIEVLFLLRNQGVNASLVLMGHGPEEKTISDMATQMGIDMHITFLPAGDNVGDVLTEQIDVLMLPSDFEGTPRIVLEAQACGVPVICSSAVSNDLSVVPELFHRMSLLDGHRAWAEMVERTCGVRVSSEYVASCFEKSCFEIENQADMLIGRYKEFLKSSK